MKFSIAALISTALVAVASAQDPNQQGAIVTITSPLAGTKYKAGDKAIISWINPKVQTISQIVLARGPSTGLQPLNAIATNVNAQEGKYIWEVPTDCTNADDYAFEIGTSPQLAFAGPFGIEGCSGGGATSKKTGSVSAAGGGTTGSSGSSPSTGSSSVTSDNAHASGGTASASTSLTGHIMSGTAIAAAGVIVAAFAQLI